MTGTEAPAACAAPAIPAEPECPPVTRWPGPAVLMAEHPEWEHLTEPPASLVIIDQALWDACHGDEAPTLPVRVRTHGPMSGPAPDGDDEAMRAHVSRQWAEDWNCPEGSAYDNEPPASAGDQAMDAATATLTRYGANPKDLAAITADHDGEVMPVDRGPGQSDKPEATELVSPPRPFLVDHAPDTNGDERQEGPGRPAEDDEFWRDDEPDALGLLAARYETTTDLPRHAPVEPPPSAPGEETVPGQPVVPRPGDLGREPGRGTRDAHDQPWAHGGPFLTQCCDDVPPQALHSHVHAPGCDNVLCHGCVPRPLHRESCRWLADAGPCDCGADPGGNDVPPPGVGAQADPATGATLPRVITGPGHGIGKPAGELEPWERPERCPRHPDGDRASTQSGGAYCAECGLSLASDLTRRATWPRCQFPCDLDCKQGPFHCWNHHRPARKSDWHDPVACDERERHRDDEHADATTEITRVIEPVPAWRSRLSLPLPRRKPREPGHTPRHASNEKERGQ